MKTIVAVVLFSIVCSARALPSGHELERWKALSQIETSDNDFATGRAGEISRYAITPSVWRQYAGTLPLSVATNPFTALQVGEAVMKDRVRHPVTDWDWCLLWHCPSLIHHPTVSDRDYAKRFVNLLNKFDKQNLNCAMAEGIQKHFQPGMSLRGNGDAIKRAIP